MSNLEINWWAKNRGDGTDPNDPSICYGKTIAFVELGEYVLAIQFDDGTKLLIKDDGQQCCESRYLSADGDTFGYYAGATLLRLELKEAPTGEHGEDVVFLDIQTSAGTFTLSAHNEHNGYYGGFDICAEVVQP